MYCTTYAGHACNVCLDLRGLLGFFWVVVLVVVLVVVASVLLLARSSL